MYSVKEIFYTLQGEGARAGRPAVFLRFSGCNFWNGKEEDRNSAICNFCDTDFVGTDGNLGGKYNAKELAQLVLSLWPDINTGRPYVVCTGGEPLLQLDRFLIDELHNTGFEIAVETNGSIEAPDKLDWICSSPKTKDRLRVLRGNELKLIYPQNNLTPSDFEKLDFDHFYLQAMDGPYVKENIQLCIQYCLEHPNWMHSLQTHKMVGLP
ncbi:MAG: 7-carboxy-7-deazaguanine synthase [Saprospiraceae bacterium]|nr:7-carboxy-7-deazaguanine synthase [Saprospiraceae bacterium]